MNTRHTTLILCLLSLASPLLIAGAQPEQVSPLLRYPAHEYINRMYGSKAPYFPLTSTIGSLAQAFALTSTNEALTTTLYTLALATRALDATALLSASVTAQPGKNEAEFNSQETPGRLLYGALGLLQASRLPYHLRLIRETKQICRAARQRNLKGILVNARNARLKNSALRVLLFWVTRYGLKLVNKIFPFTEGVTGAMGQYGIAILISRLADDLFLDTDSERVGIEEKMINQGARGLARPSRRIPHPQRKNRFQHTRFQK